MMNSIEVGDSNTAKIDTILSTMEELQQSSKVVRHTYVKKSKRRNYSVTLSRRVYSLDSTRGFILANGHIKLPDETLQEAKARVADLENIIMQRRASRQFKVRSAKQGRGPSHSDDDGLL